MAQDLIDKIREQAQARGLDPEVAVRIAQVESSLDPSAKAKTSSAQGLFQVVDKTWKDFGGKPGLKNNPDENIRVGLNILESNTKSLKNALGRDPSPTELYAAHFLGAQGAKTVLTANPDTPVSELLSQRAIKANPTMLKGKSAQELIAVLDAKMGMPGSRPTAQQPAPVQAPMPAPAAGAPKRAAAAPVKQAAATGNLGAGYQAALALSFLGDEEEDGQPLSREEWQARTDEKSAADMLAGYKSKNALSEINWDESSLVAQAPPPKRMAEGGEVKEPSLIAVPGYSEMVARDMYPAQQGQFDQQDAARHMLASGTLARKYGPGTAEFLGHAHEVVTSPMRFIGSKLGLTQMPVDYEQDLHNNRLGIELARRSKSQKDLEDLVQTEAERAAKERTAGKAWVGRPQAPVKRADGSPQTGESVPPPTQEEIDAAMRPMDIRFAQKSGIGRKISTKPGEIDSAIVQGISEMPYNVVGAPVDLATLVMRPFGYTNPAPTGGSEYLKQKATAAGIRPAPPEQPTARAFYELGQLGSSLVNPAAPVRGAVAAGQAAGRTARQAMQDFQGYNRQLTVPSASYAVKPKGGVSAVTTEPGMGTPMSDLDNLLKDYVVEARTAAPENSRETLVEFLRTKAPKYFTNTYGTASDPLREAIRSSRIAPMSKEAKAMPFSLIETARNPQARDHAQAAIELEKAYDDLTGIYGLAYRAPDSTKPPSSFFSSQREKQISAAMGREGVPVEARNPPLVDAYAREEFAEYPYSSRALRAMVESPTLPPHLQRALKEGETIYDAQPSFEMLKPGNVVDALSAIPANKLKNMSFPEALIQGMQATAPLRDYKAAIEIADRGGAVPQAALMKFTQPVVTTDKGTWVRLTDPLATKMEGRLMNHSVDGYAQGESYGTAYTGLPYGGKKAFEDGFAQVYSLRDKNGKPMVTVEVANKGSRNSPELTVTQVRGRFNSEPAANTQKAVFDLFDKLDEGGKLKEIRPNSYSVSPTGERLDQGSQVDWGRLYEEWKLDFAE